MKFNLARGFMHGRNYFKGIVAVTLGCFSFVVSVGVSSSKAEASETFYIQDGMALNTNMKFSLFDSKPRMSIYQRNDNDPDQQFERFSGNKGGVLLKNRSTGMCLNAHYLYDGAQMNTWPCDANDIDQNWQLVALDNGWQLIRRAGTGLCVDTPTRSNAGKVHLWKCDSNHPNQRWRSSAYSLPPLPTPPVQITEQKIPLSQYEVWIVARKPENSAVPSQNDAGHAWISIVRRDYNQVKTFRNGVLQKTEDRFDRGGWQADTTYGFWPDSTKKKEPLINYSTDFTQTNKVLRGESISKRGFAVRKGKISTNRANWIKSGAYREAGCNTYIALGGIQGGCNCADYASREWHVLTAKQDDFRVRAVTINLTLDSLVDKINEKNRKVGDFVDNGNVWP